MNSENVSLTVVSLLVCLLVGTDQVGDGGQIGSRTLVEHFPSVMLRENRDKNVADIGAVRQLQTLKPFIDVDVRWRS